MKELLEQAKKRHIIAKSRHNAAQAAKVAAKGRVEYRQHLKTQLRHTRDAAIADAHRTYEVGLHALDEQYPEQAAISREYAAAQHEYAESLALVKALRSMLSTAEAAK